MAQVGAVAAISLLQASTAGKAAKAAKREGEISAQQQELAAVQRETDRKNRLSAALASQVAESGAKGISAFEGSPLAILQEDIQAEKTATKRDIFQTRLSAAATRARGRSASQQIKTGATLGLLQSGAVLAGSS